MPPRGPRGLFGPEIEASVKPSREGSIFTDLRSRWRRKHFFCSSGTPSFDRAIKTMHLRLKIRCSEKWLNAPVPAEPGPRPPAPAIRPPREQPAKSIDVPVPILPSEWLANVPVCARCLGGNSSSPFAQRSLSSVSFRLLSRLD